MHFITLDSETEFDGWRKAARNFVLNDVKPADVTWRVKGDEPELFAPQAEPLPTRTAKGKHQLQRPRKIRRTGAISDPASRSQSLCHPLSPAVAAARSIMI